MVYLKTPQQQKRHVLKKSLYSSSQDDVSMSTSVEPIKELSDEDFTEKQIHLIPKLPGQTSDEIKIPTREVFEYAYKNFTDSKVRQYLEDVQPWLYFIRYHKKPDCSIPILDYTGKPYTEVTNFLRYMHRKKKYICSMFSMFFVIYNKSITNSNGCFVKNFVLDFKFF